MPANPHSPQVPLERSRARGIAGFFWSISAIASGALVLQHLGAMNLPGCGGIGSSQGSGCGEAIRSVYGSLPLVGTSTASLGLGYFTGQLVALARGFAVGRMWATVCIIGALASVGFLGVMIAHGWMCPWCIGAHAGNLVASTAVVTRARSTLNATRGTRLPIAIGVASFACLAMIEQSQRSEVRNRAREQLAESIEQVRSDAPLAHFEGRWRTGPRDADIRIVMFTDHQCPDCKILEAQLSRVMSSPPPGVRVCASIRYFPLSTLCNTNITQDMHGNACWAARAAESAGRLGGTDAFWAMHGWLFERGGKFETMDDLRLGAERALVDVHALAKLMEDPAVDEAIRDDISLAMALGIEQTPMIFINGVELEGWLAPDALVLAVEALAVNGQERARSADAPATAQQRAIRRWANAPTRTISPILTQRVLGGDDAQHDVLLIGDLSDEATMRTDTLLRTFVNGPPPRIRYSFTAFPLDTACNTRAPSKRFANSCWAARIAEAAFALGGDAGYWAAHDWLAANRHRFAEAPHLELAQVCGLDAEELKLAAADPAMDAAIASQVQASLDAGVTSLPALFIDGKHVSVFEVEGESVLPKLLSEPKPSAVPK